MALSKIPAAAFSSDPGVNFRNLIINGDMSIAQRGTSVSSVTSTGFRTCDRFQPVMNSSGTWTISQSTDVPSGQGFYNSFKFDCTTADASPNYLFLKHAMEGQMLQQIKKGTSNAESLTLSFWVKSSKTGTYIAELYDRDNSRTINKSYTIDASNTWEKKTITFEGDISGAFDNDNNSSLELNFWLASGSSYNSGTLQTSWGTYNNPNRAVGNVNLADSTSNEWYITGVQLEVGTSASDFEFLPHDVNFERCKRYYVKIPSVNGSNHPALRDVFFYDNSNGLGAIRFSPYMRAKPSVNLEADAEFRCGAGDKVITSGMIYSTAGDGQDLRIRFYDGNAFSTQNGQVGLLQNGLFTFNAEL